MGWRDELRPASFRGVPFFIETSQFTTGRRIVTHEFPNRDEPYTEDLGRVADGYEIEGHVLGDDYLTEKKKLQAAFIKKGPGELVHPYYGKKFVQVGVVNITEATRDGAIASFTARFVEAGDNRFPKALNDKGAILDGNVVSALEESKKDFDDNFSIVDMPGFAVDSARALVSLAQQTFDDVTKTFADVADAVADLAFSTRSLVAEVNDLLQAPSDLSARLLDSFDLMENAFSKAKSKTNAYSAFFNFGDNEPPISEDTPTRQREKKNSDLFKNFMKRAAAAKSASTAIITDYASFEEAEAQRFQITDVLEAQVNTEDETELFQALSDVNASLVEMLPDVDSDLPNIKEISTGRVEVSLLLTYDLFESTDKEQDIISRNNIRHPGFIPNDKTLEVLDG